MNIFFSSFQFKVGSGFAFFQPDPDPHFFQSDPHFFPSQIRIRGKKCRILIPEIMFRKVCDSHCAAAAQARGDQPGAPEDVQPYRARGVGGKHSFTHFLLYHDFYVRWLLILRCAIMM